MGAVCSSSRDAVRATKNHAQHCRLDASGGADWSSLPEDLLLIIMGSLDIAGLVRSGAVCTSWHDAYSTFRSLRQPSPKQGPSLLYLCNEYGPNHAALYCPSNKTTFRVPFPDRLDNGTGHIFFSNVWVFTTDKDADPYLLNPVTGVQATLPSVKTLPGMEIFLDDDGNLSQDDIEWARDCAYSHVAISATCTVLVVHEPDNKLSFAKPGNQRWELLSRDLHLVDVCYNYKDSLFYGLRFDGSVYVLDITGPPPVVTRIMCGVTKWGNPAKYLTITPSGELWQVWRIWDEGEEDTKIKDRRTFEDILPYTSQDRVDFISRDDDEKLGDVETDKEEDIDEPVKPRLDTVGIEVSTCDLLIFKVDIDWQKLVELRSIGERALFLGHNSAVCLPTVDFPAFEPNRAYLTDDFSQMGIRRDLGMWTFEKRSLQNLS